MNSKNIAYVIFAFIAFLLWRQFRVKNELQTHMENQKDSQAIGDIANSSGMAGLESYPLSTFGDSPYAGILFDAFNLDNPASMPKSLTAYPAFINF